MLSQILVWFIVCFIDVILYLKKKNQLIISIDNWNISNQFPLYPFKIIAIFSELIYFINYGNCKLSTVSQEDN